MNQEKILLVGLGNAEKQYQMTRHNLGFLAVDQIIDELGFVEKGSFNYLLQYKSDQFPNVTIIKPTTFMNLSGRAVSEIKKREEFNSQQIFVFHDELDLLPGQVKYKFGGSANGHNGLKSIIEKIGKDFHRIRIGIGRPSNSNFPISEWVLQKFLSNQEEQNQTAIEKIIQNIDLLFDKNIDKFKEKIK